MVFLDIVLAGFIIYGCISGLWNGFFVELASFVSLLIGVFVAFKFSFVLKNIISGHVSWSPNTIQITAFILTFVLVVLGIMILAKVLTAFANFTNLGLLNKLAGGFFGILKTILIISVTLTIFEKINSRHTFAEKETLSKSVLYTPILKVASFVYPSIEEWIQELKKDDLQ